MTKARVTVGLALCLMAAWGLPASASGAEFHPGRVWLDTDGKPIQAHGGGILFYKGTYYWFGEDKSAPTHHGRADVVGVRCYSSRDLYHWKNEGLALPSVKADPNSDLAPSRVLERPKVIYNYRTRKFVMWMHVDSADYKYARAGVATSDQPTGPYKYLGGVRPNNSMSRDMTLFQDTDGKAYLIYASEDNATMHIALLTDDYLKPAGPFVKVFVKKMREAPAVFKHDGRYFLITSGCTGWAPNAAVYAVAQSMMGPWKIMHNPAAGPDSERTFGAQSTFVLPVEGDPGTFIFMADRWNPQDLGDSRYIWLPVEVRGDQLRIPWRDHWQLSTQERPEIKSPN
jgi:Glycosyl hydrolases family 43